MPTEYYLSFFNMINLNFIAIASLIVISIIIYLFKRQWRNQECKLIWTHIDFVERRSNLSYNEFIKEYASVGKPVIITDTMKDWPALKKWDFDFFKSKYGSVTYGFKEDKDEVKGTITVADYIDYLTEHNTNKNDQRLYLANWVVSDFPELLEDYQEPIYFPNWLTRLPKKILQKHGYDNPEIFIGHKGTSIGLHEDPTSCAAWLAVISGRKQIVFFSPDQKDFLYGGKVDAFNPDLKKFPLYAKAKPVEVIVSPGEIIYIPPRWWHHVKNIEDTIAMGNLVVNELNIELFFQSNIESYPIRGRLVPLIFQFPSLATALVAIGVI
ncbi:cupin-like domain-containing protein [Calothrix membranacea FACHB-236]|nr:cupin-like domain-containing protein [Calothrix membranacea FACHB-236]